MATLVAIRHNEKIKAYYVHLKSHKKESKVAIVACMRKLVLQVFSWLAIPTTDSFRTRTRTQ
jgi:peroxiredoxin family protein